MCLFIVLWRLRFARTNTAIRKPKYTTKTETHRTTTPTIWKYCLLLNTTSDTAKRKIQTMRKYFLNYDEKATVNYSFLFALFCIAETNKKEKIDNIIVYKSLKELANKMQAKCGYYVSPSTISRILNDEKYLPYFSKSGNTITLNTNYKKGVSASNKFVVLAENEI